MTVNESQTAMLVCDANGNPPPRVTWSKVNSSIPVERHQVQSSGSLVVKNVVSLDNGVYECEAENILGRVRAEARLDVQVAPQLVLKLNRTVTETGRNVTWRCSATGKSRPHITWSKAHGALPAGTLITKGGLLTITSVQKSDSGLYTCHAHNLLGRVAASKQLVVFEALVLILKPPENIKVYIGTTVLLPCAARSDLQPRLFWKYNGNLNLPSGVFGLRNGSLVIPTMSKPLEGNYTCTAQNPLSSLEASSVVRVKDHGRSCSAIKNDPQKWGKSGSYVIDPDGQGGLAPFIVFCDMNDKNGVGVTVISHDSEGRTLVDGYESPGSYAHNITYTGTDLAQLSSLTAASTHCEQFIKYECRDSVILHNGSPFACWVSRNGQKMTYWGGASPGSGKCACGMTNSCAGPSNPCNCDSNDNVWREDSGLLTDKSALPVTQLRFGDTGDGNEQGYPTLGKLKCYGAA